MTDTKKVSLVGKITVKNVFGSKGEILKLVMGDQDESHLLMRVAGIATETFSGEGDLGPYVGLKGQFMATNMVTGARFRSGKCFLPATAVDLISGAVSANPGGAVQFGFDVLAHYDESAATSYVYDVVPLMDIAENDPLAQLAAQVGVMAALEAPKENTDDETESGGDENGNVHAASAPREHKSKPAKSARQVA